MNIYFSRALVLTSAALILSACRAVVDTKISDNGSGELRSSVIFSAEEKANFESPWKMPAKAFAIISGRALKLTQSSWKKYAGTKHFAQRFARLQISMNYAGFTRRWGMSPSM